MRHPLRRAVLAVLLMTALAFAVRAAGRAGRSPSASVADEAHLQAEILARLSRTLEGSSGGLLHGRNGWLFLPSELRSLAAPPGLASRPEAGAAAAEPLASGLQGVRDFRAELAARGVDLLVVLVPPKIAVYPESLLDGLPPAVPRLDVAARAALAELERSAIPAVDLLPRFLEEKGRDLDDPLYVPTDSHWSSRGCRLAARQIADRVAEAWPSLAAESRTRGQAEVTRELFPIDSDLLALLPAAQRPERPRMLFHRVAGAPAVTLPESREILLVGDSHLLVWRGRQGGLTDHLQRELGLTLPQIAVRAGGPVVSRQALARNEGALDSRKLVIWVFAARLLDPPLAPALGPAVETPAAPPASDSTSGRTPS